MLRPGAAPHARRSVLALSLVGALCACTSKPDQRIEDVRAHGAKGDGRSDDTLAFQRALRAADGGVVDLGSGTYAIRRIVLGPGHRLRGNEATTLRPFRSTAQWLSLTGPDSSLEGVDLDVGGMAKTSAVTLEGRACTLRAVSLRGIPRTAVAIDVRPPAQGCVVERVAASGGSSSVRVAPGVRSLRLSGCDLRNWLERGIWVRGDERGSVEGLLINDCRIAATAAGGRVRQPIQVNGHEGSPHKSVQVLNCRVTGRYTDYSVAEGTADLISLHHCHGLEVSGNTCMGGGEVGITVSRSSRDGVVTNNACRRNGSAGIAIGSGAPGGTTDILVANNTCVDNGWLRAGDSTPDWARAGVVVEGADRITVRDNVFGNSREGGWQLYGVTLRRSGTVDVGANEFWGGMRARVLRL